MNVQFLLWLTFGLLLGVLLGFAFGKGDVLAPVIVGAVGALLGSIGFASVSAGHSALTVDPSKTNYLAILGALLGATSGSAIGALSDFGKVMISILNPDLPERDFGASFGAFGGSIVGALLGACLLAAVGRLLRRRKPGHGETSGCDHNEGNTT